MKSTRQKNRTATRVIVILISLFIVAGLYIGTAAALKVWPFVANSTNSTGTPSNNTPAPSADPAQPSTGDKGSVDLGTTDQIPVAPNVVASITQLEQKDGSITFTGSATDSRTGGKCSISFSNNGDRPVSRIVDARNQSGKAVCGPVSIPETEFSYLGDWKATFRYYINDTQAVAEKTITIK